jgi:hypothetical protein
MRPLKDRAKATAAHVVDQGAKRCMMSYVCRDSLSGRGCGCGPTTDGRMMNKTLAVATTRRKHFFAHFFTRRRSSRFPVRVCPQSSEASWEDRHHSHRA